MIQEHIKLLCPFVSSEGTFLSIALCVFPSPHLGLCSNVTLEGFPSHALSSGSGVCKKKIVKLGAEIKIHTV